jgi:DNA-binding CsgD family transcriptional regulator
MEKGPSLGTVVAHSDPESAELAVTRRRLVAELTPSERNTLWLFASGMHRRDIAERLRRTPKTISNCLTIAKEKLGARSLAEAVALLVASIDSAR